MKNTIKNEYGALAVETILGLTFFIAAFLAIVSLALIMRLESITQYAIDQTAKEVSEYYYILDKADLIATKQDQTENVKNIDTVINDVCDFSSVTDETISDMSNFDISNYEVVADDISSVMSSSEQLWGDLQSLKDAGIGTQMKAVLKIMSQQVVGEAYSRFIAAPLCRLLVPKYISSTSAEADEYLQSMGIENGISGMDFGLSTFLDDGRSINIVMVYQINLKAVSFNLLDYNLTVKQVASTAAWLTDDNTGIADLDDTKNMWSTGSYTRNNNISDTLKSENSYTDVEHSIIDLYDSENNTLIEIESINTQSQDEEEIQRLVNKYVEQIQSVSETEDIKSAIPDVKDGDVGYKLYIYIPEDTGDVSESDIQSMIDEAAGDSSVEVELVCSG